MLKLLLNVLGFQLGWAVCVLGAAKGVPWAGPVVAFLLLSVHGLLVSSPARALGWVCLVGLGGLVVDSLLGLIGVLHFHDGWGPSWICPPWLVALWMLLATTAEVSLRWLHRRGMVSSLVGAVCGPLSYYAGDSLGALSLGLPQPTSLLILAMVWAVTLPLLVEGAPRFGRRVKSVAS